jgi:hypothetical protein
MESPNCPLLGELLARRTLGGEVEDEYLQSAHQSQDGLVVARCACIMEMRPERAHERPHVVVSRSRPVEARKESRGVAQLASPSENVLVGAIDLPRRPCRGDRKFVPRIPKVRALRRLRNLGDDAAEDVVGRGEANRALHLNFQSG